MASISPPLRAKLARAGIKAFSDCLQRVRESERERKRERERGRLRERESQNKLFYFKRWHLFTLIAAPHKTFG